MAPPLKDLRDLIPDVVLDLRYHAGDPGARALLRAGCRLLVYDAYRPLAAQRRLWALNPDPRFVADPAKGSMHSRGAALDCGLAGLDGCALAMPSDFDEFSERAAHSYRGGAPAALARRDALRRAMEDAGLQALEEEWWHYSDPAGRGWPLLDEPL